MIRFNSEELTAMQAEDAGIDEMQFDNRTDEWWDGFWTHMGLLFAGRG